MITTYEATRIIDRVIDDLWGKGNLDLADQLFAPGYINHGGLIPDAIRGPEAVKLAAAFYRTAFPGLRITIAHLVLEGERATFSWSARNSPYPGKVPASTQTSQRSLTGMMTVRIAAGRITESWMSWDAAGEVRRLISTAEGPRHRSGAYVA
jgi:hypothetical protein